MGAMQRDPVLKATLAGFLFGATIIHATAAVATALLQTTSPWQALAAAYGPSGLAMLAYHIVLGGVGGVMLGLMLRRQLTSEVARVQTEMQLLRAQRMEAVAHVAAGVQHDVNNLLSALRMRIRLAHDSNGQEQALHFDEAERLITKTAELPQRILGYARNRGEGSLQRVVTDAVEMVRPALGSIVLTTDLDDVAGEFDAAAVEQIVANLLINARDAQDSKGHIEVTLKPDGEDAILRISDQGPGIPDEILDKVFEPLFSTKEEKGTGLGLSTCRALAQAAGGDIRAFNDDGAVFEVRLPGG